MILGECNNYCLHYRCSFSFVMIQIVLLKDLSFMYGLLFCNCRNKNWGFLVNMLLS